MQPPSIFTLLFTYFVLPILGQSQQVLKLCRGLPGTIELPADYTNAYSNPDGSLSAYESAGGHVYRIYLSGVIDDFTIPTVSYELEMKQKINDQLYASSSLIEWDERQLITRDDRKVKLFSTEYLIFPKGNRKEYKSIEISLYDGEYKYGLSLEYESNIYQYQITPFINSLLESFLSSGRISGEKIQLIKDSGIYKIPVTINGSAIANFILDTGASSILLSKEFMARMKLSGSSSESDFLGYSSFIDANGDTTECKLYLLHTVKIGTRTIQDVKCAVADISTYDMLLGQSFLEKLGTFNMNYHTNCLEFK